MHSTRFKRQMGEKKKIHITHRNEISKENKRMVLKHFHKCTKTEYEKLEMQATYPFTISIHHKEYND